MSESCEHCGGPLGEGNVCLPCAGRELESSYFSLDPIPQPGDASRVEPPVVPGWDVLKLLGVGGMGQLWLGRRVGGSEHDLGVLKLVPPGMGGDVEQRFESEAEILASLDHPHILQLLDICTAGDGRLCIVTEYVDGCDLRRLLRAENVPAERAIDIFQKVCAAVAYAHGCGVIHRDLKPSNILVDAAGTVKVADFGLAKELGSVMAARTSAGDGLGTPYYLAPELLRGAADADERADVYSLGVLLHEMLTGSVPLGTFATISERCGLERGWDALVKAALMEEPSGRPPSPRALSDSVRCLWDREQKRGSWRGHRRTLGIAGVVLIAGLAGAFFARHQPAETPAVPDFPDPNVASIEQPWTNSLGLEFVPLPEHEILIGRTEVRTADMHQFREYDFSFMPEYRREAGRSRRVAIPMRIGWGDGGALGELDPSIRGGANHPAFAVTESEAHQFCAWLTMRERQEGRISPTAYYRLPTRVEWLDAASGDGQSERELRELGNFAGPEAVDESWPQNRPVTAERDPFPRSAPVGSFPPNALGLFDLFGNVSEWVVREAPDPESDDDPKSARFGGSWGELPSSALRPDPSKGRRGKLIRCDIGLRVVLDLAKPDQ